jgi:hypothetical protein
MCRETAACEAPASGAAAPVSVARPTARQPADLRRTTAQAVSICATVVFGTEFSAPIMRFGDIPAQPGQPPMAEADRKLVITALAAGGTADMPLSQQCWGGYFGILVDEFGIRWMFNCASPS